MTSDMEAIRPRTSPVRSYLTRFELDEETISEGGLWLNGRKDGIDWCDVLTRNGVAYGEVSRMTAAERRSGRRPGCRRGRGKRGRGRLRRPHRGSRRPLGPRPARPGRGVQPQPTDQYFQEVEIRLRSSITPHNCTGYEVFFRCLKTGAGYAEIVRWNGPIGDFTSLNKLIGPEYGVQDGDVIAASIVGDEIRGYINGVEVIAATDDRFATGSPGVGFNFFVGDTNVDHGLKSFEVDTYED